MKQANLTTWVEKGNPNAKTKSKNPKRRKVRQVIVEQ